MSGLYLIGVIALWLWLTSLLWKGLKRWRSTSGARRGARNGIAIVVALLWFAASFWYAGARKFYYDWRVDQMCAIDGGVKVYETVKLPMERFNQWGQPRFYKPNQGENALGQEYVFKESTRHYKRGIPKMIRHHYQVIRRMDGRLLGETVSYGRGGGDLTGPWHPSSYTCPDVRMAGPNALITSVFIQTKGD